MKRTIYITCLATLSLMTACIKEDGNNNCKNDYIVNIGIADKNYANIAQFPQWPAEDEKQPFEHFENTLYYTITEMQTGKTVRQSDVSNVHAKGSTYQLVLKDLPFGEYKLTVWGNLTPDVAAGTLHPNNTEHTDIYAGSINFLNKNGQYSDMELYRTKGKILIFCTNFPDYITRMHQNLTGIYSQVDASLNYTGNGTIDKDSQPLALNALATAPATVEKAAKLHLTFYKSDNTFPLLSIPEINLNIRRNELTAVNVDFNQSTDTWEVWIYLDRKWTLLHHLTIK